jgi:hypothetical protein
MKLRRSLVATTVILCGSVLGFVVSSPGCCQNPSETGVAGFQLGDYEIVSVFTIGDEDPPVIEGIYTVTTESVVVRYEGSDGTAWTVTYDVVCGNFDVPECE